MASQADLLGIALAALAAVLLLRLAALALLSIWQWLWGGLPPLYDTSREFLSRRPFWHRLGQRFPWLSRQVRARLDPHRLTGLPLTLVAAACLYMAALFAGLVEDLAEAEELVRLDGAIDLALDPYRVHAAVRFLIAVTMLADGSALVAAAVVASGFLWAHGRRLLILPLWVSLVGAQATTWAGKYVIGRERPDLVELIVVVSPSFPSGHATGAMAVYGFIAYAIARDLPHQRQRFEIGFWTLCLIALIGFSRMFLGVHFTSDVAAGLLVGGFWLLVALTLAEWLRYNQPRRLK